MRALSLWILLLAWMATLLPPAHATPSSPPTPLDHLSFVENRGQAPKDILAYTPTQAGMDAVTRDGRLIHLVRSKGGKTLRLEERFAAHALKPAPRRAAPTRVSYFTGKDPESWRRDLPTHREIALGEAAPGVSVRLLARPGNVEKRFHLAPGTDPAAVSVEIDGAERLSVDAQGRLVAHTRAGEVRFTAPVAWQPRADGGKDPVQVAYAVQENRYGFRLGPHDPDREVVIDPLLGTALLRDSVATIRAMAVDPFGDVFITGATNGSNLEALANGYDQSAEGYTTGETVAYVAKFSRDLKQLLALTFLGGSKDTANQSAFNAVTRLTSLAVTPQGEVYAAGFTNTDDYPVVDAASKTTNALKQAFGGYEFVLAAFSNDLTQLTASAYLAGNGDDGLAGAPFTAFYPDHVDLALAPDGQSLYLAGTSNSSDLPTNQGSGGDPNQPAYRAVDPHDGYDCYLAQLPLDLSTVNATWVGNNAPDGDWRMYCSLVDTDGLGSVFVAGYGYGQFESGVTGHARSQSSDPDSPYSDNGDVMVARLSADLRTLHNGTFLGGFDGCFECDTRERPWDMVVTDAAEVVLVGQTPLPVKGDPNTTLFPTTAGALIDQTTTTYKNTTVGFVARLDNSLQLQASTLLHACPPDDQGVPDCDQGGSGFAAAVTYYSYYNAQGQTQRDIYVLYWQNWLNAGVHGYGNSAGMTGSYLRQPPGVVNTLVGPASVHRLSEDLGTRIAATDLSPRGIFNGGDVHNHSALAFTSGYFDGSQNRADPRLYLAFSGDSSGGALIRHPQGYTGPTGVDPLGNPYPDEGPYVAALDADLSAGDQPALTLAPTGQVDLGYLPANTQTAAHALTLTNNSNLTLTVYDGAFEDNGLGAHWGYAGIDGCLTSANNYNFPFTLGPGASCRLYIQADAVVTDPVTFQGRLHLVTNDPNGALVSGPETIVRATPLQLAYTGSSIYAVDYLGEGLDFGSVDVGNSEQRTVTAHSRRDGLQLGPVTLDQSDPFSIVSDGCSNQTLNNGETCTVTVRYQPNAAGTHEAQLAFANPAGGTWVALRLHGVGTDSSNTGGGGSGGSGSSGGTSGSSGGGSSGGFLGATAPSTLLLGLLLAGVARRWLRS